VIANFLRNTWRTISPFPLHQIHTWTAQGISNVAGPAREKAEFTRLIESGDEVVITYEAKQPNGSKGVNTEILAFDGDKLRRAEVYFGWSAD
jgi:hypothetical protein